LEYPAIRDFSLYFAVDRDCSNRLPLDCSTVQPFEPVIPVVGTQAIVLGFDLLSHWGITIILAGHLLAILFPQGILLWNQVPLRLYLLEITGIALGVWASVGMAILLWRRVTVSRVRVVSTPMDFVVLILVLVSMLTGVIIASYYRWGSYWFTGVFTPYVWSILTFQPNAAPLAPLPFTLKLHVFNFYMMALAFPFTRLVHIITWPLGYLLRPWQIVIWLKNVRANT